MNIDDKVYIGHEEGYIVNIGEYNITVEFWSEENGLVEKEYSKGQVLNGDIVDSIHNLLNNFNPEYIDIEDYEKSEAAQYQGKKVTLNKPFRLPTGSTKKFGVYTKNDKGNVVFVRFGDPNMSIKKNNPERRKSFRARHKCDTPGPKWKPRYWSCKMW